MTAPDRPTREQVDAALAHLLDSSRPVTHHSADVLAAEVRALRAEVEAVATFEPLVEARRYIAALQVERDRLRAALVARTPQPAGTVLSQAGAHAWDAADAVAVQLTRAVTSVLGRCNDEIENRPGCSCAGPPDFGDGVYGSHEGDCESQEPPMLHAAEVRDLLTGVARLPAVPDGEDAETGRCDWCESEVPLTSDGYMHGHKRPDDGADCAGSHDTSFGHLARRSTVQDGGDVPARLDAAAEALEALHSHGLGYELRQVADQLRDGDGGTPELRAAVAAALALPAERDGETS